MKLYELINQIKDVYPIEDEIQAYIYTNGYIKFVSVEYPVYDEDTHKEIYPKMHSLLFEMKHKDNVITLVEPNAMSFITPSNLKIHLILCSLINKTIDDLTDYPAYPYIDETQAQIVKITNN